MDLTGTFPFGWLRGVKNDNWQIIWDPKAQALFLKASKTKDYFKIMDCNSWDDAKILSDDFIANPDKVLDKF